MIHEAKKKHTIKVAYLILGHQNTENIIRLTEKLLTDDLTGEVFIHYDARSNARKLEYLSKNYNRCHLYPNPIKCDWGKFSLVAATLALLNTATTMNFDYYMLLSESCYPIKPINQFKSFLSKSEKKSFIESQTQEWIKAGMKEDRYYYYHFLNYRKHPKLFKLFYRTQKILQLKRSIPPEIQEIRFGSQWWCLHKQAIDLIINYTNKNPQVINFFRYVWIPDECFFQTLIWNLDKTQATQKILTFYKFDHRGRPLIYHTSSEVENIIDNEKFFCRKIGF